MLVRGWKEELLKPLPLNIRHNFDEFSVILLDANHVPGAVMFIFEGPKIRNGPVLCTGHFRADASFYCNVEAVYTLQQVSCLNIRFWCFISYCFRRLEFVHLYCCLFSFICFGLLRGVI